MSGGWRGLGDTFTPLIINRAQRQPDSCGAPGKIAAPSAGRYLRISIAIAFVVSLVSLLSNHAGAAERLALLIGNAGYAEAVGPLRNPINDVKKIDATLTSIGFKVTTIVDADYATMQKAINNHIKLVRSAGEGAISFFYFSGHGAADVDNGLNYLIPIDVKSPDAAYVWKNSIEMKTDITDKLSTQAPAATHYVIFDACRTELELKLAGRKAFDINGKGFVTITSASGMLIAFATAPRRTASDLGEGIGQYARILSEELVVPGRESVVTFRAAHLRVREAIAQSPWITDAGVPLVYFAGPPSVPDKPGVATVPPNTAEQERAAFDRERASSRAVIQATLNQVGEAGILSGGLFHLDKKWSKGTVDMCFYNGSRELRSHVARVARQWTLYGNIDFNFGDVSDPRMCIASEDTSDVRITFAMDGNWSYLGTDHAHAAPGRPTLSLHTLRDVPKPMLDTGTHDREILHEFGHVLGFDHPFKAATAKCDAEFDWAYINKYFGGDWFKHNLESVDATPTVVGAFDKWSVMNYDLPDKFFIRGRDSRCFMEPLKELSLRDKLAMVAAYK